MTKKYIISASILVILGIVWYAFFYKNTSNDMLPWGSLEATVERTDIVSAIRVTGKAALANEQKLRFGQTGKVEAVFVKPGDAVKKGQVLASLDKREFFQEVAQTQSRLDTAASNLAEAKKKAFGTDARRLDREIENLERKLADARVDLSNALKNAPGQTQEKVLDLEAKKREVVLQKEKYELDRSLYEKDLAQVDALVAAKIDQGKKTTESLMLNAPVDIIEIKKMHDDLNRVFGFGQWEDLSGDEQLKLTSIGSKDHPEYRREAETRWRSIKTKTEEAEKIINATSRIEYSPEDAKKINTLELEAYTLVLELIDYGKRMIDDTETPNYQGLTEDDLKQSTTAILAIRSTASAKLSSAKELQNTFLTIDTPEKTREKVLAELRTREWALATAYDAIQKLEIAIQKETNDLGRSVLVASGSRRIDDIVDNVLRRELKEKEAQILDQEDTLQTKKEELEKLTNGKTDEIRGLENSLRDQRIELEKFLTKEEQYEIRAPFEGVIRSVKVQPGDTLSSVGGSNTDDKNILLENDDYINVNINLDQLDIVKIQMGQTAQIRFDALPDVTLSGVISEISSTPNGGEGSVATYEVKITTHRGDHLIYSGMNANVEIELSRKDNVLSVPITAITPDPQSGWSVVQVIHDDGSITPQVVEVGVSNQNSVEILSGVEEGQRIRVIDFDANTYKPSDFMGG